MRSPYLPGGLVMAELAQEVDLLDKLPVIEAQVEDPVTTDPHNLSEAELNRLINGKFPMKRGSGANAS